MGAVVLGTVIKYLTKTFWSNVMGKLTNQYDIIYE